MRPTRLLIVTTLFITCALVLAGIAFSGSRFNPVPQIVNQITSPTEHAAFPQIDSSNLTSSQQKIVALLRQEYDSQPKGTKYSEGANEPWCADFVSWIYKEASIPLINPNSRSWRIPGTYTLQAYYQSVGKFKPAGSGYSPSVGDIMLYDNPSPFGQHTNIVIKNDGGIITTVGGNEPGGIRVVAHKTADKAGFIGYGTLK